MNVNTSVSRLNLIIVTFVLSAAMLSYEILLTRMASLMLASQFVFFIIGISLLGISAGAVVEYYLARRGRAAHEAVPGLWLAGSALALVGALVLILTIGGESGLLVLSLAAAVPFAVSGFVLSRLFRLFTEITGFLYAADLIGAGVGALLVPLLLPMLGPVQSILLLAAALAGTGTLSTVLTGRGLSVLGAATTLLLVGGLFMLNVGNKLLGEIPVGKDPDKDLYRLTTLEGQRSTIIDSRWSTFGRTDLVRFANDSSLMTIFIDGAAGANMLRYSRNLEDSSASLLHALHRFAGIVPLLNLKNEQKENALVIGPGGGRDVLVALKAGFKKITAVEINPQTVAIVKDHSDFNGGLYTDYDNVQVIVDEGRNFLRHSDQKYDLITLFMPITKSSRSLNAFALSESYLFTKEAFVDYHRHLTDDGTLLIMGHSMPEIAKAMTTALAALRDEGVTTQQGMSHLYILGSDMMPLFGMRKRALRADESSFLHAVVHTSMFDSRLSYIPGVEQRLLRSPLPTSVDAGIPMMNPVFIQLAEGQLPVDVVERGAGFNLAPATDDRPFFSQYDFAIPSVVLSLLWLSLAVLAVVLLLPGYTLRARLQKDQRFSWWLPAFFVSIGVGYIAIELALFQKLVFYLGDPSRSLALLLAALLMGGGIGSAVSGKFRLKGAILAGFLAAAIALLALILLSPIFRAVHGSSPEGLQAVAAAILFVQGLPMGVMFPAGLRLAEKKLGPSAVPWMWAINGSASVLGSALATGFAMVIGYSWSLAFGALSYLVAAGSIGVMFRSNASSSNNNE